MARPVQSGGRLMPANPDTSRLQGFSDAVFALSATLLVVTLEVPDSYDALLDAVAGLVHESLGLEEQCPIPADAGFRDEAGMLGFPIGHAIGRGNGVNGHKADIVAVARILGAGIAKSNK